MITVYYAKVFPFLEEGTFFAHKDQIDEKRRQDIIGKKNKEAKARSLAAGVLLHAGLCKYLNYPTENTPPFQTECGQWGKPYLVDYPGIHFNLSHSGEYVCCVVADREVGVDVQKHQEVKAGLAQRFFPEEDNRILAGLDEKERKEWFFRIWSIRESYIKFTGKGMREGLDSFGIDWKNQAILNAGEKHIAYFEENRELMGYSMCVCGQEKELHPRWVQVELGEESRGEKKV